MDKYQQAMQQTLPAAPDDDDLPEGLWRGADGRILAECNSCGKSYQYEGDPADGFDQNMSYCGGSQYCVP